MKNFWLNRIRDRAAVKRAAELVARRLDKWRRNAIKKQLGK